MNDKPIDKPLVTDWDRIDAMTDEEIDTSDIPPLPESFFKQARVRMPSPFVTTTLRIDQNLLEWFRSQGGNYEERINVALRLYAEIHQAALN